MTEIESTAPLGLADLGCEHGTTTHRLGNYIPQLRPHYQRRDKSVFFLISRLPSAVLSSEEVPLYDRIEGRTTLTELERMYPGATHTIVGWQRAGLLELIPPVQAQTRPHLVVVEPHMDDAALSAGGRLLHRRGTRRITLLSVVKWSNFTSYLFLKRDFTDTEKISELRQQESALVARVLGAEHQCLDWTDAPLRLWPSDRWSSATVEEFNQASQDFVKGFPRREEIERLAETLLQKLNALQPDELWIPMGLGDHLDHRITRSACLMMLQESPSRFTNVSVSMYEDLPYAAESGHSALIRTAMARCGTRLIRATEDITDVFEEKIRLSSIYASQFKTSYLEPMLAGFASREGDTGGRLGEAFHRVEGQVALPLESDLSRDRTSLIKLANRLHSLLRKRTKCRRIDIATLPTSHLRDLKTASGSLAVMFPNAVFHVYAPPQMAPQTEVIAGEKFKIEFVYGGWAGWLKVFWRGFLRFRTPTVIMWRGAYSSTPPMRAPKKIINMFLKSLLPFRQVFFSRRLSDFCCVLFERSEEIRRQSPESVNCESGYLTR